MKFSFPLILLTVLLSACQKNVPINPLAEATQSIDGQKLKNADGKDGNWLTHGLNYAETRHSPLNQITPDNISDMGLAWSLSLGTRRGVEATPLVSDGYMFLTGSWSTVYAVDLRTGEFVWLYDPEVPRTYGERTCCDVVNRGVALYEGKVLVGTLDGRLVALNAMDGSVAWEAMTVDSAQPYTITGAPRVINGKVIIGNGGAEFGVRGYFSAYDADTGELLWRFYTVPGNPAQPFESKAIEAAAKTWTGEWWKYGGGGTVWDAMAFDPDLNLLYIGTGNGSPWDRNHRSPGGGDNLYLSSILAVNPDNGELVWHYQTTPGDSWDFTATQHIILADLEIDGELRKVLMQAPKNGFFYVLDRTNGSLISAEKFTYVNWADSIDSKTGRPVETAFARYDKANVMIAPSFNGGHNWQPMAFDPTRKLVFIPAREDIAEYGHDKSWKYNETGFGTGIGWNLSTGNDATKPNIADDKAKTKGMLLAWDPINQREVWRVEQDIIWNGGLLHTASGLLFQGTADGRLIAYSSSDGKLIWEANLQSGILATPITYLVDGKQYVTIVTGWGGGYGMKNKHTDVIMPGTIFTFAIGGNQPLPSKPIKPEMKLVSIDQSFTTEEISKGETLYWKYCGPCHVVAETGGGIAPGLGYSTKATHEAFNEIVIGGRLLPNGMPNFEDRLTEQEVQAIQGYILEEVRKKLATQ